MFRRLSLVGLICLATSATRGDVVLSWNQVASDTLLANTDLQNPGMASRTMAMVNLAIHDSLAMTRPGGKTFYHYAGSSAPSATGSVTAAVAAHAVLRAIYPDQQSMLDERLQTALGTTASGPSQNAGIQLGNQIAQSILSRRANDGYNVSSMYQPSGEIGSWSPDPINPTQQAWGPDWGSVSTFAIPSVASFLPPAPPDLSSQAYADAFNEVQDYGAFDSPSRTTEQTEIGKFWAYDRVGMGTPLRLYSQALRTIAETQGNTTEQNAELFAKASVAMADAGIVAWNSKFEHELWRPITGIRQGDSDGNPLTVGDPDWVPLGAPELNGDNFTPPFPTYLSGHATFGGALFGTIEDFYGTDQITFSLSSDELDGQVRTFTSLTDAMMENGRSRVYLGIHWNFDDTEAQLTGMNVASYISNHAFVSAVPEPSGLAAILTIATVAMVQRQRHVKLGETGKQ